jgi:putative membrane protein
MESLDLWIKTLRIVFVISWMAGLLFLPRLFVYHADAQLGSELSERLKIMERRPLKGIVNATMVAVWVTGSLLACRLDY